MIKKNLKIILKKIGLFRSTSFIYNKLLKIQKNIIQKKALSDSQKFISKLDRGNVNTCWCGGIIKKDLHPHPNYGACEQCKTHVNTKPIKPEELKKFYSFDYYWNTRQELLGHPNIKHRIKNDQKDGRLKYWLSLIQKYFPQNSGSVIEVGCGHGVLLQELNKRGYQCVGIEVDDKSAQWTQKKIGVKILSGIFPFLNTPKCDLFLAFDVLEHSNSPVAFIKKIDKILNDNGVAIIQSPFYLEGSGFFDDQKSYLYNSVYNELEHLFIFNKNSLEKILVNTNFKIEYLGEGWKPGHELLILKKQNAKPLNFSNNSRA